MNIILIGAQGSGKGTQAARLSQTLGVRYVASGELFRKAVEERSELGMKVKEYLDRGDLVPDDVTVTMILDRLKEPASRNGVLLDGFPRNIPQAQALDEGLQAESRQVDVVLYLNVPRDMLVSRLSGRYICRAKGHVYNINTNPPKAQGICDIDGSELFQRPDDQGGAVQKRLNIFFKETVRLIDYYGEQHKLVEVNGNQSIEQVQKDLVAAVHSRRQRNN